MRYSVSILGKHINLISTTFYFLSLSIASESSKGSLLIDRSKLQVPPKKKKKKKRLGLAIFSQYLFRPNSLPNVHYRNDRTENHHTHHSQLLLSVCSLRFLTTRILVPLNRWDFLGVAQRSRLRHIHRACCCISVVDNGINHGNLWIKLWWYWRNINFKLFVN